MALKPIIQEFIARAHTRSLPKGQTILHPRDAPQSLFLLIEGSVSVLVENEEGRELVLAYLGPGDFFGEMCLFPEQKVRTAIVRTREPALVAEIAYDQFRRFSHERPDILYELAEQLSVRVRDTSQRLADLAFLDVAGRIAHILIELCSKRGAQTHPRGTTVRISRQELARNAGCSREMAGRVLKKMQEDGLVLVQGRAITLIGRKAATPVVKAKR